MNSSDTAIPSSSPKKTSWTRAVIADLLLLIILLLAVYFRSIGTNWDSGEHLHPDERFLTLVAASIRPVDSLAQYFNTAISPLNPNNVGQTFYVYGTLPLFLVRYVAEWFHQIGYQEIYLVGRQISALADVLTVFLVFLIGLRLYNRKVGLLAAAFSAFAVLQIQLAHYFTVDSVTTLFSILTIYAAVRVLTPTRRRRPTPPDSADGEAAVNRIIPGEDCGADTPPDDLPLAPIGDFILFGVALGMAMASKVSAFPLAALLPAAVAIHFTRLNPDERQRQFTRAVTFIGVAALVSVLFFRIFQPYAFSGPGFFGVKINPIWMQSMRSLAAQSSVDSDAPYALQWARRPLSFAWTNMVQWGLGLPLGLLAWAGVLWMGWRILRGKNHEWRRHTLLWVWTVFYFIWQSISWVRTMRYQILIYPTLAIIAAWLVVWLWERGGLPGRLNHWLRIGGLVVGAIVLAATFAWAFAFTRIYTWPITRVAGSEWVYQNIPAPINLSLETDQGITNVPLTYSMGTRLVAGTRYDLVFTASTDSILTDVSLPHVFDLNYSTDNKTLQVSISPVASGMGLPSSGVVQNPFNTSVNALGDPYTVTLDTPMAMLAGEQYRLTIQETAGDGYLLLTGSPALSAIDSTQGTRISQSLPMFAQRISTGAPYVGNYLVPESGTLREIHFPHLADQTGAPGEKTLQITVVDLSVDPNALDTATVSAEFSAVDDPRGTEYTAVLDHPLAVKAGNTYLLMIEMTSGQGEVTVYGDTIGIEYPWDDPIPLGLGKYSAYDALNMMYPSDLAFDLYTTDSADKKQRFINILDNADYVIITSSRQWGSIVRVPERYPMTREYYRALIGCPSDRDILVCYADAKPGDYSGELGFELTAVFQSNPNLGSFEINDQLAEEAFTVYDHPKVLIFKKTGAYSHGLAQQVLDRVDLNGVVPLTPRRVTGPYKSLLLPQAQWTRDQDSGSWAQLFDLGGLLNRIPALGAVVWYLLIFLLGVIVYPLVRLALPGLSDRGYPVARTVGLLLFAWLAWLGGSAGLEVNRLLLLLALLLMILLGAGLAYLQRRELSHELRTRAAYYLSVELVALLFFGILLAVRLGNPDLWHVAKGGEKPMDFSYFNAVLKSATFPPYDPWYAGGYINYYYYGYVIVGMPVKLLGIEPSVAYNLILPTLFSLLALGGFSAVWNLLAARRSFWPAADPLADQASPSGEPTAELNLEAGGEGDGESDEEQAPPEKRINLGWIFGKSPFWMGLAGSVGLVLLGNLGTVRMVWYGLMRLAAPGGVIDGTSIFSRLAWTVQGLLLVVRGASLPYGYGDWYWIPSRAIPAGADVQPITEFPNFTFLYADLHAHMIALPLTALALVLVIAVILGRGRWGEANGRLRWPAALSALFLGGLVFGALRPTNTWDFPTYLLLGSLAVLYTLVRYVHPPERWLPRLPEWLRRVSLAAVVDAALVGISLAFYQPFSTWYAQAYNAVMLWSGSKTPFWSYLTHWGLFLFIIVSWMFFETHQWMASTPMSHLRKLEPFKVLIQGLIAFFFVVTAYLLYKGITVSWLIILLGVWAVVLILRPDQSDAKRLVLFLVGCGLALTLFVEVFVLKGDIGRMNTVFKFYLQVWTLFAVCAAAGLGWLIEGARRWRPSWTPAWQTGLMLLVFGAALFPVTAGIDKVRDRMAANVTLTLDGMAYMQYATYSYNGTDMDLSQDYRAIRWMQANVSGSPVIVEANLRDLYRWGSRMTIYTGLPGVVGWEWHQQQQRATQSPLLVTDRIQEIEQFYLTVDLQRAQEFLRKYNVEYIVVGQLERVMYPGPGLDKFSQQDGVLWDQVYADGDTVIYQVKQNSTVR